MSKIVKDENGKIVEFEADVGEGVAGMEERPKVTIIGCEAASLAPPPPVVFKDMAELRRAAEIRFAEAIVPIEVALKATVQAHLPQVATLTEAKRVSRKVLDSKHVVERAALQRAEDAARAAVANEYKSKRAKLENAAREEIIVLATEWNVKLAVHNEAVANAEASAAVRRQNAQAEVQAWFMLEANLLKDRLLKEKDAAAKAAADAQVAPADPASTTQPL